MSVGQAEQNCTYTRCNPGQLFVLHFALASFKVCLTLRKIRNKISASADEGPSSRISAPLSLRSGPHRHQQIFFVTHVMGGRGEFLIF